MDPNANDRELDFPVAHDSGEHIYGFDETELVAEDDNKKNWMRWALNWFIDDAWKLPVYYALAVIAFGLFAAWASSTWKDVTGYIRRRWMQDSRRGKLGNMSRGFP